MNKGNLYTCEGGGKKISKIDTNGNVTTLCDNYKGKKFNAPNDLWRDKKGGIYFTDPGYSKGKSELDGSYVFYLPADSKEPIIVVSDMSGPNGIVGTRDGKLLYVADYSGRKTFVFKVNDDGTLSDKKLFVPIGADGIELDEQGNLYLTDLSGKGVNIVSPEGKKIGYISVPSFDFEYLLRRQRRQNAVHHRQRFLLLNTNECKRTVKNDTVFQLEIILDNPSLFGQWPEIFAFKPQSE